MSAIEKAGRVRIQFFGRTYTATWTTKDGLIEVVSAEGSGTVRLGGLATAPSAAAAEKLRDIVTQSKSSASETPRKSRFNVRDA